MELRNFHIGRHLYLVGRPSHWASAHILVIIILRHIKCVLHFAIQAASLNVKGTQRERYGSLNTLQFSLTVNATISDITRSQFKSLDIPHITSLLGCALNSTLWCWLNVDLRQGYDRCSGKPRMSGRPALWRPCATLQSAAHYYSGHCIQFCWVFWTVFELQYLSLPKKVMCLLCFVCRHNYCRRYE